jgi:hypothetical protein
MCYLFGLLWSSVPFFGWSSYVFEGAGLSCAISYEYDKNITDKNITDKNITDKNITHKNITHRHVDKVVTVEHYKNRNQVTVDKDCDAVAERIGICIFVCKASSSR